jgi:hypothetical protein
MPALSARRPARLVVVVSHQGVESEFCQLKADSMSLPIRSWRDGARRDRTGWRAVDLAIGPVASLFNRA